MVEALSQAVVGPARAAAMVDLEQLQVGQRAAAPRGAQVLVEQLHRRVVLAEHDKELGLLFEVDQLFDRDIARRAFVDAHVGGQHVGLMRGRFVVGRQCRAVPRRHRLHRPRRELRGRRDGVARQGLGRRGRWPGGRRTRATGGIGRLIRAPLRREERSRSRRLPARRGRVDGLRRRRHHRVLPVLLALALGRGQPPGQPRRECRQHERHHQKRQHPAPGLIGFRQLLAPLRGQFAAGLGVAAQLLDRALHRSQAIGVARRRRGRQTGCAGGLRHRLDRCFHRGRGAGRRRHQIELQPRRRGRRARRRGGCGCGTRALGGLAGGLGARARLCLLGAVRHTPFCTGRRGRGQLSYRPLRLREPRRGDGRIDRGGRLRRHHDGCRWRRWRQLRLGQGQRGRFGRRGWRGCHIDGRIGQHDVAAHDARAAARTQVDADHRLVDGMKGGDADAGHASALELDRGLHLARRQSALALHDFGGNAFRAQAFTRIQAQLHGKVQRLPQHGATAAAAQARRRRHRRQPRGRAHDNRYQAGPRLVHAIRWKWRHEPRKTGAKHSSTKSYRRRTPASPRRARCHASSRGDNRPRPCRVRDKP